MTVVAQIRKNAREEIRISCEDYMGHDLVNLRVFYEDADGDYRPGKKGLAFRRDLLPDIIAALQSAEGAP